MKHTPPPPDLDLKKALHQERHLLTKANVPIVTLSASFKKELADHYQSLYHTTTDVVYSRAHYSMAEAVRQQALLTKKSAHLVDPTNFVSKDDWNKIAATEKIGQLMARYQFLKWIKDRVDTIARSGLPISEPITPPLLYLTEKVKGPIVSLHYEVGNILAKKGKKIVQVITDPHVRRQYLDPLPNPNIHFAVFDEQTRSDLLKKANKLNKQLKPNQITVTGPPIDPRITKLGKTAKKIDDKKPINLAITTGGLGTNLNEIKTILGQLTPLLKPPEKIRLFLYAGTHKDFRNFFEDFAAHNHIRIGNLDDEGAHIRILYEDSIIDANENLIKYMFPWAHGIITKPSGDMAYDAAAAGCFLLFLSPWGPWEENIQDIFVANKIGHDLSSSKALLQFQHLLSSGKLSKSLHATHSLPSIFRTGAQNILKLHSSLAG